MSQQNIDIGTAPSSGDGDPLRVAFTKINDNFTELYSNVANLSSSVSSVAGRTGDVQLTVNDIIGFDNYHYANIAYVDAAINQVAIDTDHEYLELTGRVEFTGNVVTFAKPAYTAVGDEIDANLTLTRAFGTFIDGEWIGGGGALYNSELEQGYDPEVSPAGTLWNADGWDNLDNVKSRYYSTFKSALRNAVGANILAAELIMWDTANDKYYKVDFSSWAVGPSVSGVFAYTRTLINTTQPVGLIFADGTVQTSAPQDFWDEPQIYIGDTQNYTLRLEDRGHHIYASGSIIEVPNNSQIPFPIGSTIRIIADFSQVQIVPAVSSVIYRNGQENPANSWVISAHSSSTLTKVDTNTWRLTADDALTGQGGGSGSISVGNGSGPSIENVTEILINGDVTEIEPGLVGISVAPSIPNTIKGFINLVGNKPNNSDEAWFESVAVHGQYAYVGGGDFYVNGSDNLPKIYKFDLETGNQIWVKQIVAGRGAEFTFSLGEGLIIIDAITLAGQGYKVGEELYFYGGRWNGNQITNLVTVIVDTISEGGGILTASIKPGYDVTGLSGTYTGQIADNNNAQGAVNSIAYDAFTNNIVVVAGYRSGQGDIELDDAYIWTNVYILDPITGNVEATATLSTAGDIYANSIKITGNEGEVVIVGEKFGEYRQFGNLTLLAGYNGYFDVLKSEIDAEHYPGSPYDYYGDFWVSGTGIVTINNVDNVNYYPNLAGTVRQGSGAIFTVQDNGNGTYGGAVTTAGINYLPGHKILILGTSLGGTSPTNDAIIEVTVVGEGGSITGYSITGLAAGVEVLEYTSVTGTNYNVGDLAEFNIGISPDGTAYIFNGISNTGLDYVPGDVITIVGTSFAGGASPANDVTVAVASTNPGNGNITDVGILAGTPNANVLRIFVDGVDFSVEGTWSMKQNLGGEAFVWTPTWTNAIGGPTGDRFFDVCYSQDGSSIFAVGTGRYETTYDQALVVKFNAGTGAVVWGKDIKFTEAITENRQARSVCLVPGSSDIIVAGMWVNPEHGSEEVILTRMTEAGVAVWQKTYLWNDDGITIDVDYEMKIEALGNNFVISVESNTPQHNRGLGYIIVDASGVVINSRVLSADGNSNYNYYDTPTPNFSSIYTDGNGDDYLVFAGHTYIPTDNFFNALLIKLPLDGYKNLAAGEYVSLGEHILGRYMWNVITVTPAFDSFTATEHVNTIVSFTDQRDYATIPPAAELQVFKFDITDDSAGYLEFGDGSRQSFATNIVPQIPAANSYYLTEQDSGKHIFFESSSGRVYIPHWQVKNLPVGFTVTIINTTGNDCYVECEDNPAGDGLQGQLKLAGRNIQTYQIGIPDSGSGSMVTLVKVKSGYSMLNTDANTVYSDIWIVSGPGDVYDSF